MRQHGSFQWPAPSRGWVTSGNYAGAPLDSADRLDNFFPTAQGAELRKGCTLHATLDDPALRFMHYNSGSTNKLFAATSARIYEIASPASASVTPTPKMIGLGSGDWSSVQFGTAGGNFMIAVNGTDYAIYEDGTDLVPLVDETVIALAYDAQTGDWTVGETVTGGTSGASAEILAIAPTSATAGTLYIGAITSGPFQDNEALTDGTTGAATSNIPSGTSTASTVTITNVATANLKQVWINKSRVFFVEKNSLSAWYLPADSIGGAASEINLSTVFADGGTLLFGASWSVDSGAGMDDKCVFVTDQGEVAVYSGTDPSSANTWALEGVYRVGAPVDKHGHFAFGGELMVVANDGVFPMSLAVSKDYSGLVAGALTAPIEDDWQNVIAQRAASDVVSVAHWQSRGQLFISTPAKAEAAPVSFVANTRIGAWCRYLGWNVQSYTVFQDQLYFSDTEQKVFKGEIGGTDNGTGYIAYLVTAFSNLGVPGLKYPNHASLIVQSDTPIKYNVKMFADNAAGSIPPPTTLAAPDGAAVWGSGTWGSSVWGAEGTIQGQQKWKAVNGRGMFLAAGIAVASNTTAAPTVRIVATSIRYEVGNEF